MKQLLKSEMSELMPESGGGGLSKEVYLVKHNNKKYIIRKCDTIKRAKKYETISKKLEKQDVLPKILGRYGKDVLFEFIEGRDLTKEEDLKVFYQLGEIVAKISKLKTYKPDNRFYTQLKELVTGNFSQNNKVDVRRYRERLDKRRIKPLFTRQQADNIKVVHDYLLKKVKPKTVLDINDVSTSNFRIRKGKIYFVDIEAIKPRIKGLGIAKCFLKWAKTEDQQEAFRKGFERFDKWFFEGEYADLCYLKFIIQSLNYKCQIGRDYKHDLKRLEILLNKYKEVVK